MKILVAEDEVGLADVIEKWLTKKGHAIEVSHDGEKALGLVKKNQYDIAILDFSLPEKTGLEILDYLKQSKQKTKTIMITGYQFVNDTFVKILGIDSYLSKPFKLEELDQVITKFTPAN